MVDQYLYTFICKELRVLTLGKSFDESTSAVALLKQLGQVDRFDPSLLLRSLLLKDILSDFFNGTENGGWDSSIFTVNDCALVFQVIYLHLRVRHTQSFMLVRHYARIKIVTDVGEA